MFPLTVALAPAILAEAAVAALVISTLLSALLEERPGQHRIPGSEPPTQTEGSDLVPAPEVTRAETTSERTAPATGSPSASPSVSPSASSSASAAP